MIAPKSHTCSLLNPSLMTFVFEADIMRFSSNLTVSVEFRCSLVMLSSFGAVETSCGECNSNSKSLPLGSSGNVTSGSSSSSGTSTIFSSDERSLWEIEKQKINIIIPKRCIVYVNYLFCNWLIDEFDSFKSSPIDWIGGGDIVANVLISDIEFLMSFRSRFKAWGKNQRNITRSWFMWPH